MNRRSLWTSIIGLFTVATPVLASAEIRWPEWQPIETAPKDGRFILVVCKGWIPGSARWKDGRWQRADETFRADNRVYWPLTHWMPLPHNQTGVDPAAYKKVFG